MFVVSEMGNVPEGGCHNLPALLDEFIHTGLTARDGDGMRVCLT